MVTTFAHQMSSSRIKALVGASVLLLCMGTPCPGFQGDVATRVTRAIDLMSHQPKAARRELKKIGAPAFPHILRAIRDDSVLGPIKKAFLIDVIGKSRTQEAASALTELLSYSDAFVRGLAVSHLGKRRYKPAIPYLVHLLDDKEVFVTNMQTDPDRNEPVLVRDNAMEALQAITGRTMDAGATQDERARAWVRWWEKQQRAK